MDDSSQEVPAAPVKPKDGRAGRTFKKHARHILDLETRARVWADYVTCGVTLTAKTWGICARTVYNIVGECNRDAAFQAMCQQALVKLRDDMNQRSLDAQMVAVVALTDRLRDTGHSIPDLLAAVVQLSKVNGNHKGDKTAAAQGAGAGRGASIMLPAILTQPREDSGDEPA